MKSVSRVWEVIEMYVQAMSFLLALFCMFAIATPRADAAELPSCVLSADKTQVVRGESVTLTWESKNATEASTVTGERNDEVSGSITVNPLEDTIYLKRVYGEGGEGACRIEITVEFPVSEASESKMVWNPFLPIHNVISQMQLGAVVVAETFSKGMYALGAAVASAATTGIPTCSLKGPANGIVSNTLTLSWTTTGNPTSVTLSLGATSLGSSLAGAGSKAVTAPAFPAKYNYHLKVTSSAGTSDCYAAVPVLKPGFTQDSLAKAWPQLYAQMGSYNNGVTGETLKQLFPHGFKLNIMNWHDARATGVENYIQQNSGAWIDNRIFLILANACAQTPDSKDCTLTAAQQQDVLNQVQARLDVDKNDSTLVGYYVLDDYFGDVRSLLEKIHALVVEANKTSVIVRPMICSFEGYHSNMAENTVPFSNYTSKGCDAVNIYEYGRGWFGPFGLYFGTNAADELLQVFPKIKQILTNKGWNPDTQPIIGMPQAFTGGPWANISQADITRETKEFCEMGASSILFFTWNPPQDVEGGKGKAPSNTPYMVEALKNGLAECNRVWADKAVITPTKPAAAIAPSPANNATDQANPSLNFSWANGGGATSYKFYFGTTASSVAARANSSVSASVNGLLPSTTYYWRVDSINSQGTTQGTVWKFTTKAQTISNSTGPVTLYEDCNYGGYSVSLGAGSYGLNGSTGLKARGVKNDDISSIRVAPGYTARLYRDDGGHGAVVTLTHDASCFTNVNGINFDNELSSLIITKDPTVDTTAPSVTVMAPANGSTVSGNAVTISVTATDNVGVTEVKFAVDGHNVPVTAVSAVGTALMAANYRGTWNSVLSTNGEHIITATAKDAAGNSKTASVRVIVSNTVAVEPSPTCTLSASRVGVAIGQSTTLSWSTTHAVSISLNQNIGAVSPVNGGTKAVSPRVTTTYTATVKNSHNVSATCSKTITVTPTSPADTTAPSVSVTAPSNGAAVWGRTVTVSANANDNVAVVGVQFKRDGLILGAEDTTPPYSMSWNTMTISNRAHTISAVARDAAGNRATSTITVIVSNTTSTTTQPANPGAASNPSPANGAGNQSFSTMTLSWTGAAGATRYGVYFGTTANTLKAHASAGTSATLADNELNPDTTYYWRVDSWNSAGTTTGSVWSFTTGAQPPVTDINPTIPPVTVYRDCNYAGTSATFGVGNFDLATIVSKIGNDVASAIKIPAGYTAVLYQDQKFVGPGRTLSTDENCFVDIGFNDKLSSMKVTAAPPTCTLTASDTTVTKGSPVTLTWTSHNATHVSTYTGVATTVVNGSAVAKPTADTIYIKHVYGPGGEATCQVKVDVSEDINSTTITKLVWNPVSYFSNLISQMQLGAVVVAETLGIINPNW